MKNLSIFSFVNGHNSRTVKVTPPKFNMNLFLVVMSIEYNNIWLLQTKVRERKTILGCTYVQTDKGNT